MATKKQKNLKTEKQTSSKEPSDKVPFGKSQGKQGEPQTMEELLTQTGYQIHGIKRGAQVSGKITMITSKAIFVDIGAKAEGIIADKEFEAVKDFFRDLKIHDKIVARVISPENDAGQTLLSLRTEVSFSAWKKLAEAKAKDEEISVQIEQMTRGGYLANLYGIPGFIPTTQLGTILQDKQQELVGKTIKIKILEIDEAQNRLILSEKAVSEKEKIEKVKEIIRKVKVGDAFDGEITGVMPFGVFVKVSVEGNEIEGLVHISELSWERITSPENEYKVGKAIKVKVIGKDETGGKLSFTVKQLTIDPWLEQVKKYEIDAHVSGKITRLIASGALIEIEPGIEGLLHISKIPVEKKVQAGDTLNCFVEAIEPEKRKISLGLVLTEKPIGYK